ncbi:uncharacterized protein FFB20_11936 [Fusarium fujikuroi]|nr:uncharacterized protein Y057_4035 [Fusarium fujikuroi]QGI71435.1 hypothetical protein CEK27_003764 [Fusarium fujikuroi]QGJ02331.1 hypothetical protein CEK26_003775 [Fusarium fujikuroi]SCO03379.1 uncharacterized protein FFB20_11936 [Fusarium fujikuroi]SCO23766.1 uncharacterized protein FFE2_15750 [Fusarium fujikuroi]
MADTINAVPTPPQSTKNKNKTHTERVQRAKNRIHLAAGVDPSSLLGQHSPASWAQSLIEQLATIIELARSGTAGITVEQLVARLKDEATRDQTAKGVVTNSIVTRIRLEITGKSQGCAPPNGEDEVADPDADAHLTSSPSKGRPCKRRRKNSETEHDPQAVRTDAEDEEDAEGSRRIVSPSAEAKGPLPIDEYHKRIAAHRERLQLFENKRDAAQALIKQADTLNEALQKAISSRDVASAKSQESASALTELEALVAQHGHILPSSVRDSIPQAKQTLDEANRETEQAEVDLAAAQKRVDGHAERESGLQHEVGLMNDAIAGCVDDIGNVEKDLGAAICLQRLQRVNWEVLRARSVEQVNDLLRAINDFLEPGEGAE